MDKKVVLITGAAKGIGKAVVEKYSESNYRVVALDKAYEKQEPLDLKKTGSESYEIGLDVSDQKAVLNIVEAVEKQVGPIDILVSVAGIFESMSIEETSLETWNRIFQVNTTGVFNVTKAVAQKMKDRKAGSIVVVSSNASKYPRMGMSAYASSKAAVSMYTKCLALEMADHNIRCNIVSPGSTDTDMQRQLWNGAETVPSSVLEGDLSTYRLGIPLKKIAEADEVAELIYFMASDKAGHITMEEVTLDGGATMGV
jgi:2,3-dihydro-2,3-dihydroxybenzoate dehydrogenase